MQSVTIYTGDNCKFCRMAKSALLVRDIDFQEISAASNASEFQGRTGGAKTVPQIFIGEHHVGGFDQLEMILDTPEFETLLKG